MVGFPKTGNQRFFISIHRKPCYHFVVFPATDMSIGFRWANIFSPNDYVAKWATDSVLVPRIRILADLGGSFEQSRRSEQDNFSADARGRRAVYLAA